MVRTDLEFTDIKATAEDLLKTFEYNKIMMQAIKDGSMGKYGVTFKLTTQVIGSWIYKSQDKEVKNRNPTDNLTF